MPIEWTKERLATLSDENLKTLQQRAAERNVGDLRALCDAEILRRKPPRQTFSNESRAGQYVSEFHFVCPNESEIKRDESGLVRTGTWVVAEEHATTAATYGSFIALHTSKSEPSYLQGKIKHWRRKAREPRNAEGDLVKNEFGIEFEFEPTHDPLPWKGDGSGEKGYGWLPIPK